MKFQHMLLAALFFGSQIAAQTQHQPYKGLETRGISSLSESDIEALQNGTGWGLALPAELNGYPGPAHVLELRGALGLSDAQTEKVHILYEAMKAEAMAKGDDLIEAERRLDEGFEAGNLTPAALKALIANAEAARAALRFVHLSQHLETKALLSDAQTAQYSVLRGYGSDPCQSVPEGHDATMWRRHNGCDG